IDDIGESIPIESQRSRLMKDMTGLGKDRPVSPDPITFKGNCEFAASADRPFYICDIRDPIGKFNNILRIGSFHLANIHPIN
ncbi:MAG: hypothetical protein II974_11590, partial [Firmicutes bacterium]|nr:hypothetical protein [Bacillota bacterium]